MPTYDGRILGRLFVRVAIVLASLAWAGFVVTSTVADPGRGERIASAVLADPAARAEVTAPITAAVMNASGLPPEQRPLVAQQVEQLLADPAGARSFIDPFAAGWARLWGEPDPRPAQFDLAPWLGAVTPADAPVAPVGTDPAGRLPVPGVPLPSTELGWMGSVRSVVAAAVLPLALGAAALFGIALAVGDRRRVLRRFGLWACLAGGGWVVVPPLAVWAARRWASGADAVAAVVAEEATAGVLPVAIVLAVAGAVAVVGSFAVRPAGSAVPAARPAPARRQGPVRRDAARRPAPATRPASATAEMPVVARSAPTEASRPVMVDDATGDPLWDYYTS